MPEREEIRFERLADWVEGRLSEEEARAVEEQVAADEATRAEVEWLRAFARMSENIVFAEPPQEVRDELIRRFDAYAEGRRTPGFLERLIANLSFDSGLQPAFGVRSGSYQEAAQRQLIYTTDAAEVALNIRPRDGRLDLDGQVFSADDPASFSVQLLSGTDEVGLTATDELGQFGFESVPPGAYQVLVSSGRIEILIPPVELRVV